jgi:hypothetical protein
LRGCQVWGMQYLAIISLLSTPEGTVLL